MASLVRILAVLAASIVALSFVFFALDQSKEGSENQVRSLEDKGQRARSDAVIDTINPGPKVERTREQSHSAVREYIDDGNDILLAPFATIIDSANPWPRRLLPGVIGLLLYGVLGLMLANVLPRPKNEVRDWREAPN